MLISDKSTCSLHGLIRNYDTLRDQRLTNEGAPPDSDPVKGRGTAGSGRVGSL